MISTEEYVFALSHMFFQDKAWTKNEILERMNEKIYHLHSFVHFSGLFHICHFARIATPINKGSNSAEGLCIESSMFTAI